MSPAACLSFEVVPLSQACSQLPSHPPLSAAALPIVQPPIMADAEVDEAFPSSTQAADETAQGDDNTAGETEAIVEQIESSDEYDPAQIVQDTSLPDPPDADSSTFTHSVADASANPLPPPAHQEPPASVADGNANEIPQSNTAVPDPAMKSPQGEAEKDAPDSRPASAARKQAPAREAAKPPQQKVRLPHDTVGKLEDRIEDDPKGDTDAWRSLIEEHKRQNRIDDVRKVYVRFFEVFPTAVRTTL